MPRWVIMSTKQHAATGWRAEWEPSSFMCRYDSDITCSYPISGQFSEDQRTIYQGVLNAHQAVIKAVKPGVAWPVKSVHAWQPEQLPLSA